MRKLGVPLFLFALIFFPLLAAATTFGPEIPIAPAEHGLAFGFQVVASLACNGQSCLALWYESDPRRPGLFSSVIDGDGTVRPAASNLVRAGGQGSSSLVWTGDHYLAVWNDAETRTLVAAPLSAEGLLTGPVHSLTAFPQNVAPDGLAWNGRHGFVLFVVSGKLEGALVDANGNLVRTFVVSSPEPIGYAVAAAGQTFAVAWGVRTSAPSVSNEYLKRFDDSGTPIDSTPIALATNLPVAVPQIRLAASGSQFGAVFITSDTASIQRVRIDAASGAVDTLPQTGLTANWFFGLYWSGDDFVTYFSDIDNIDTQQFTSPAVRVLDVSSRFLNAPQIVQGPGGAVAIWIDSGPSGTDQHLLGAMLDRDSTMIRQRDVIVARSAVPQNRPALAISPAGALLVWQLQRSDHSDIVATRLDRAGNPVDAAPIAIGGPTGNFTSPSVAWLGSFYLVTWPGQSILGKRVSASGAVLDAAPIVLSNGPRADARLASNGTTTILATLNVNFTVELARLNAAGAVIDTQTIATGSRIGTHVAAATNGSEFVVAWTEDISDFESRQSDIYAVRLSAAGLPIDAAPIVIANSTRDETSPAIGSDGRDFFIVYTDDKNVAMKRLLREGAVIDAGRFSAFGAADPRITFAGGRYFLTWSDLVQLGSPNYVSAARTATVDQTGAVIDPPSVFVQSDSDYAVQTALIPGLVAYSRGNAADSGIPRVFAREIVTPPLRTRAVRH